jgi:hypothetical protein
MQTNKENTTTICITREHDKICILEKLLNGDSELETLVSNFIDTIIAQNNHLIYFNKLKTKIHNDNLFDKIIQLSLSIAYQTPFKETIEVNETTDNFIKYLKKPFIPLLN